MSAWLLLLHALTGGTGGRGGVSGTGPGAATIVAADPASLDSLARGAAGIYATLWAGDRVVGCRGFRGAVTGRPRTQIAGIVREATTEAELQRRPGSRPLRITRARITFLRESRPLSSGAAIDPAREALHVTGSHGVAVILPGEALTSMYAWRKAARLLGQPDSPRPIISEARAYRALHVDLQEVEYHRLLKGEPPR